MVSSHGPRRAFRWLPVDETNPFHDGRLGLMKVLRRVLSVLALAGAFAAVVRVRGMGGTPPKHGGWRPLELNDD